MSNLIVYSTISGNTKAVCERIYDVLDGEKKIVNVKNINEINTEKYNNIIVGFWCDRGSMDKDSMEFISKLENRNIYFLGTLGARPESEHWKSVFENAKNICSEKNNYKDGLLIWGRISKEMMDRMSSFPEGHYHSVTPERKARWKEASTHPDENDFKEAENFFKKKLNK